MRAANIDNEEGKKGCVSVAAKTINPQQPANTQIQDYLRYCELNREFTSDTIKTKYYHLNRFARDNKLRDFREVTNLQVDIWRAQMFQAGVNKKTINNHVDDVTGCVKYLKNRRDQRVKLKLEAVERYRIRYDNEDLPSFSPKQIDYIKKHCATLLEEVAFSMIFESAMRLHELTYLQVEDVRLQDNGEEYLRIEGKGRKKRNTFIMPESMQLLNKWLALTGIEAGYVFPSPVRDGLPYTNNQMRKIISRPIRRAGFEFGGPQALRRSSITIALDSGMPLQEVTAWVGHADPRVTQKHYYKRNTRRLQASHHKAMRAAFSS